MIRIIEHRTIMKTQNDSIFSYFAWPSIARLADGRLACVSSGFRYAHICPFGKAVISYSEDEGKTWTSPAPVIDTPLDDRDAGIMPFGDNQVIFTSFNNSVQEQRGYAEKFAPTRPESVTRLIHAYLDNVTKEQEAKYLGSTYKLSCDGGYTWGEEVYRLPVSAPHGPICKPDGSLIYVGRVFESKDEGSAPGTGIGVMTSKDGLRWSEPVFVPIPEDMLNQHYLFCEPHAIVLPSGKIIVHIRVQMEKAHGDQAVFAIYQSVSEDDGKTFSVPVCVNPCGSPPHLMLHSSGALICTYGYRSEPYGQRIMISWDEGKTWTEEHILRDDGASWDLGYPASVELKNGNILSVYYQRPTKDAPSNIYCTEWALD